MAEMAEPQEARRAGTTSQPASSAAPLPPGATGLPLLGETLPFLKDGFGFCASRAARWGPIFRTRILGRPTAVLAGPDASGRFIDSEVQRAGAMPPHVQELFGGISLPLLDGDPHLSRKTFILQAFTRDALGSYLAEVERLVGEALDRWATQPEVVWIPELRRLAIEVICATVMGIPPGPETEALRADYQHVLRAFSHLPVPLPGTAYSRGRAALARILGRFAAAIADHQRQPRNDGLSRILAATDGAGRRIGVEECQVELHHLIIAGLIVFAELAGMVMELTRHPDVRGRLQAEVDGLPGGVAAKAGRGANGLESKAREGGTPEAYEKYVEGGQPSATPEASPFPPSYGTAGLTLESLAAAPYLLQVVMEVKRLTPIIPVLFGKARESFEFKGHSVPAGWMVLWAHRASLVSAEVYTDPERFDPERFSPARAEHRRHPFAFVPHGAGPAQGHRCPGGDFATILMQAFTIQLLRGYSWELAPGQDLDYDWSLIPPEPKSGLRASLQRRW